MLPEVDIQDCSFHWTQAVWRKTQEIGLAVAYRQDVGTNDADRDGITRIVKRYRELVEALKKTRVEQIILSGILPVMRGMGAP